MNLAILFVEGDDDALENARTVLSLSPNETWAKGDPKRRGGSFQKSGFSTSIADADCPKEMVLAIRNFVTKCEAKSVQFSAAGLSTQLSLGVTVGDTKQFIASVELSATDLQALGRVGINLSISAYSTSDEANELQADA